MSEKKNLRDSPLAKNYHSVLFNLQYYKFVFTYMNQRINFWDILFSLSIVESSIFNSILNKLKNLLITSRSILMNDSQSDSLSEWFPRQSYQLLISYVWGVEPPLALQLTFRWDFFHLVRRQFCGNDHSEKMVPKMCGISLIRHWLIRLFGILFFCIVCLYHVLVSSPFSLRVACNG